MPPWLNCCVRRAGSALVGPPDGPLDVDSPAVEEQTQRLSDQVRAILDHFKQDDPTGFPGAEVPDPMDVPPMNTSFAIATMSFSNVTVHGLSKFRFHEASVNLTTMKVTLSSYPHPSASLTRDLTVILRPLKTIIQNMVET